jgi:hypothetical protein
VDDNVLYNNQLAATRDIAITRGNRGYGVVRLSIYPSIGKDGGYREDKG